MERSEWHLHLLPQLRVEMEQRGLLSPLLWVPMDAVGQICYDKMVDMLFFAPSDWDALMGSLATLARNVFMKKLNYEGSIKSLQGCRDFLSGSPEHLVLKYWAPLKHLVDATWVLLTCLHLGRSVAAVIPGVRGGLQSTHGMSPEEQSALAASKSITLQLCHYAQWPSLMDERGPLFLGAMESASLALKLNPSEGVWVTLYARCMSWRHPDKAVLLHGAVRLSHTPFTVVEFATLLAMSSNSRAVELAAKLITCAVQEWSENIYVNTSYVTLLLTSNCRSLLSLETALECLGRARKLAPNSPLLSGYYWSLHDIQRAGGQLSPILEESAEDMIARGIGQWDAAKEARMRELAAQLYPGAAVVKTSTASQLLAAPPQEQPSPTLAGEDLNPAMRSPNLWGPAAPRRAPVRRSATPPLPSSKMTTPVTSPVTTPSTTPATSPSSSPPSGRRLRTQTQIGTLRMPLTKPAAPDAPSAAPDAPSAAPDAPSAAPEAPSAAPAYRLSVPPPPPSLRARTAAPSPAPPAAAPSPAPPAAAPSPAPPAAAPSTAPPAAAPSPAPPAAAPSTAPPAAAPSTAAARITAAAQNIPWASWTSRSAPSPLTPPPTPSPPREGSLSEEADTVPLWRRPTGAGLTEVRSRWRTSATNLTPNSSSIATPASMGSSALTIVMSESLATKSSSKVTSHSMATKSVSNVTSAPMAGKPSIVNCVCTSSCALLTYKSYGTLRPGASIPKLCSLK